jgi:hypothetical protein
MPFLKWRHPEDESKKKAAGLLYQRVSAIISG